MKTGRDEPDLGLRPKLTRAFALFFLAAAAAACAGDPNERPKPPPCPPPPEPEHQAVVVGTIGRFHLVESQYPLAKLAEIMAVWKPDLVLVGVRVDAFRENQLEDASFEMTYVQWLAKARSVPVEPIDWWREADLGAAAAPVEPSDEAEIDRRETEILRAPRAYTFTQANAADLAERVLLAHGAAMRHRAGDPLAARRRAWIQQLAADAALRHGKPKKVLAFVDVLDRPLVDTVLDGLGYTSKTPIAVLAASKDALAGGDLPPDLITTWRTESERARARVAKASSPAEAAFWTDRAHVLDVAADHKGLCCVTTSTVSPGPFRE